MNEIRINPTLVVGVGGTGCRVAKMLRKQMEHDMEATDRDRIPMRFIGIDTDLGELNRVQGDEAPLHFGMPISGRAHAVGAEGDKGEPAESFRKWLPKTRGGAYLVKPQDLAQGAGAGGKRLLGRYAFKFFAPDHFSTAQRHVEALRDLCNNPLPKWKGRQYVASDRIEVFVVSSLAGGTGSGCFLDAVAMCHLLCDSAAHDAPRSITLVLVTPSAFEYVAHRHNRNTQLATAYACLKDLDNLLDGRVDAEFEFHGNRNARVVGPFVDSVFLLGRHGPQGSIPDLQELYRLLTVQLYAMIGTPLGASLDSVANNNSRINQSDIRGGKKRYSTFGLVGIDYDLEAQRHREGCALADGVVRRLLLGTQAQHTGDRSSASEDLTRRYRGGPNAPRVAELAARHAANLQLGDSEDDAKPKEVHRLLQQRSSATSDETVRKNLEADSAAQRDLWRGEFVQEITRLVERLGVDGAHMVLADAERLLSAECRTDFAAATSVSTVFEAAMGSLKRIGAFTALTRRDYANREKQEIINQFNDRMRAAVRGTAWDVLRRSGFGANAALEIVRDYTERLRVCRHVLDRASSLLHDHARGHAYGSTALSRAGVVYDLVDVPPSEALEPSQEDIETCFARWQERTGATNGSGLLEQLKPAKSGRNNDRAEALAGDLRGIADTMLRDQRAPHILDVLIPPDSPEDLEARLRATLGNLTPLSHASTLSLSETTYDTARALVPDQDGQDHPSFDRFSEVFEKLCLAKRHDQPGCTVFPGPPNRLLIAKWALGFALNDEAYPTLLTWRTHYLEERARNDFLEVDHRWQFEPGPGMESVASRKLTWALGLAYGLIAQTSGNQYYNNLKTRQNHDASVKGTLEEYEVDAEYIVRQINSGRPVEQWFAAILQGKCGQTLARRKLPLAYEPSWPSGDVRRHTRDRIGTGRFEAMRAYLMDAHEDYSDVEEGIACVLSAYLTARGLGTMRQELTTYRDALAALRFADDKMASQIEEEISMLNRVLDMLDKTGTLGLSRR